MTVRIRSMAFAVVVLISAITTGFRARHTPQIKNSDRIRLAEAFAIAGAFGDNIWKEWGAAPFAVLLVTDDHEFLIRHAAPSNDFVSLGFDSLLASEIYYREPRFQPDLLATFPAVGGVATIVVGSAETTSARTSTRWVVTILHEHFHQLQYSRPDYYAAVDALELSGGDSTGMWMLNYPFPYDSVQVKQRFSLLCSKLATAIRSIRRPMLQKNVRAYLMAREQFREVLDPADYRYFSFQLWQEGVARYTEYQIAKLASEYELSAAFRTLHDYTALPDDIDKRTAFYSVGAAEAILLDAINPGWRVQYFSDKFSMERYFQK